MRPCATKSLAKLLERREESKFSMFELAIFLRWHIKDTLRDEFESEGVDSKLEKVRPGKGQYSVLERGKIKIGALAIEIKAPYTKLIGVKGAVYQGRSAML